MSVKLLTEHHFEFLSVKGGCTGSSEPTSCQNATLLEITGQGSLVIKTFVLSIFEWLFYTGFTVQWLSGRVLDWRPRGRGFEPHWHHCVVSLSKNVKLSLVLVQPRKTRPFITERLLMGRKESKQTKTGFTEC